MLIVDPAKCSGCRRCEVNCSFFHTGRVGRSSARIKVVKIESLGIDFPVFCQQCQERYCTRCPESAIDIDALGQVVVSPTLCTVCGTCETLCPIGAIEICDQIPYVCDLCGGDPRCVKACTLDAIRFEPRKSEAVSLKAFKRPHRGLDPENKRLKFALASTAALRQGWTSKRQQSETATPPNPLAAERKA